MPPLQRHALVHLSAGGWTDVRARPWDAEALACIDWWAAHRLPLVVTRQPALGEVQTNDEGHRSIALGLPAPARWSRRRIALRVPLAALQGIDPAPDFLGFPGFPEMAAVTHLLPPAVQAPWQALQQALERVGVHPQVYGSVGWQQLTGLAYVHGQSDIDLLVPVPDLEAADHAAAALAAPLHPDAPRLDGECIFPDGSAVAWREWRRWRAGESVHLLVKRRDGATLESHTGWLATRSVA